MPYQKLTQFWARIGISLTVVSFQSWDANSFVKLTKWPVITTERTKLKDDREERNGIGWTVFREESFISIYFKTEYMCVLFNNGKWVYCVLFFCDCFQSSLKNTLFFFKLRFVSQAELVSHFCRNRDFLFLQDSDSDFPLCIAYFLTLPVYWNRTVSYWGPVW